MDDFYGKMPPMLALTNKTVKIAELRVRVSAHAALSRRNGVYARGR